MEHRSLDSCTMKHNPIACHSYWPVFQRWLVLHLWHWSIVYTMSVSMYVISKMKTKFTNSSTNQHGLKVLFNSDSFSALWFIMNFSFKDISIDIKEKNYKNTFHKIQPKAVLAPETTGIIQNAPLLYGLSFSGFLTEEAYMSNDSIPMPPKRRYKYSVF